MRSVTLISALIGLLGVFSTLVTKADPAKFGEPTYEEYLIMLESQPPEKAIQLFGGLRMHYMELNPSRPDLAMELASATAKNPLLPIYCEEQIRKYPALVENIDKRGAAIQRLSYFPAEWAVRLLVKLHLEDAPMRSEKFDLKDHETQRHLALDLDILIEQNTDRSLANGSLKDMNLFGWGGEIIVQQPNEPWEVFQERIRVQRQNWVYSNQSRIPEIVKKTWGDRAVLNADLGLGPDNLPVKYGPATVQTGAPERIHSGAVAGQNQESEANQRSDSWFWLAMTIFLVGIAIIVWRRKVKYDNSLDLDKLF